MASFLSPMASLLAQLWLFARLCVWLVVVVLVARQPAPASAVLLASTSLERCTRTAVHWGSAGDANATDGPMKNNVNCELKLVVAVAVASGSTGTDQIQTVVREASDEFGHTHLLAQPLLLVLTKPRTFAKYPLEYVRSVNNRPRELRVLLNHDSVFGGLLNAVNPSSEQCDESLGVDSTCGVAMDLNGGIIPDSQGRCCSCSVGSQLGLDSIDSNMFRGQLDCALFGTGQASAHCLRFDPLWYNVYRIKAPMVRARIYTTVLQRAEASTTQTQACNVSGTTHSFDGWDCKDVVWVGTERRRAQSIGGDVTVSYVGDFSLAQRLESLSHRYMLIPETRGMSSEERESYFGDQLRHHRPNTTAEQWKDWMLIDNTELANDGDDDCNKVGIGYSAFRLQASFCDRPLSSCLANQPLDLWTADNARREQGLPPRRFPDSVGEFKSEDTSASSEHRRHMTYTINQVQDSVVTLEVYADDIRFITNRSPGRIAYARIAGFEALSGDGVVSVAVINTGGVESMYSISFECSNFIQPLGAREGSIAPGRTWRTDQPIRTEFQLGADNWCITTLHDSLGAQIDQQNVSFATNATCICLGNCNCECDPNALPVQDCISAEAPDPGDRGVTSGGGSSLSWFEGILDSLGLGLGMEFGSLLSILFLILLLFCLKKTGIFKLCCGKSEDKSRGRDRADDELGQSLRFVTDQDPYHHPPPPLPPLIPVQPPAISAPFPPALPLLLPPPVIPAPLPLPVRVTVRSPPKYPRPTRAAPCRTSAAGGKAPSATSDRHASSMVVAGGRGHRDSGIGSITA